MAARKRSAASTQPGSGALGAISVTPGEMPFHAGNPWMGVLPVFEKKTLNKHQPKYDCHSVGHYA
jgi:hypothetical protein